MGHTLWKDLNGGREAYYLLFMLVYKETVRSGELRMYFYVDMIILVYIENIAK